MTDARPLRQGVGVVGGAGSSSAVVVGEEEVVSLLGATQKQQHRRGRGGGWLPGSSQKARVQIAMVCLVLGLLATAGVVTVQRAAESPVSHSWIQQMANLAGSGDDPLVEFAAGAGAAEVEWRSGSGGGGGADIDHVNNNNNNRTVLRVAKLAEPRISSSREEGVVESLPSSSEAEARRPVPPRRPASSFRADQQQQQHDVDAAAEAAKLGRRRQRGGSSSPEEGNDAAEADSSSSAPAAAPSSDGEVDDNAAADATDATDAPDAPAPGPAAEAEVGVKASPDADADADADVDAAALAADKVAHAAAAKRRAQAARAKARAARVAATEARSAARVASVAAEKAEREAAHQASYAEQAEAAAAAEESAVSEDRNINNEKVQDDDDVKARRARLATAAAAAAENAKAAAAAAEAVGVQEKVAEEGLAPEQKQEQEQKVEVDAEGVTPRERQERNERRAAAAAADSIAAAAADSAAEVDADFAGQEEERQAEEMAAQGQGQAAPSRDYSRCDLSPHVNDGDNFKCSMVLFNDTEMTRGESHAPRWPGAALFKPIGAPTQLRNEVNSCRRATRIDPAAAAAGEMDRPYVIGRHGREKHFTAGGVFQEMAAAAAAARDKASEAAATLATAQETKSETERREKEAAEASAEAERVARQAARVAARAASEADAATTDPAAAPAADPAAAAATEEPPQLGVSASENVTTAAVVAQLGEGEVAQLGDVPIRTANNSAYMYAFLHIHKCGGTFVESQMQAAAEANVAAYGQDAKAIHAPFFENYPLMELLTPEVYKFMAWHYHNRIPENVYGGDALRNSFRRGYRMFIKSSEAMGFCDFVDAPCMYITVLREPVARFMSFYSYTCMLGAEGRKHWPQEWIDAGECALNPVEFALEMQADGSAFSAIDLLAPGGDQAGPCRVEAAKRNLVSGCTRYLLLEQLEHGFAQVRRTLPDLARLGLKEATEQQNDSTGRLTDVQKARLAAYEADEGMMAKVRAFLEDDIEVYEHAKRHYHVQWDKPLETC